MPMTTTTMKARLQRDAARYPDSTRVRLHRALSWLARAEREEKDPDARFIFLWVAFNAAYACEFGADSSERTRLNDFIAALLEADTGKTLHALLFKQFSGPIRTLIGNRFVFEPFWRALREHDASGHWEKIFHASQQTALASVVKGDTATVLSVVFDRLYVLRNQLVHGGATWAGKVNRTQVKDGARILGAVVPAQLTQMLEHPEHEFGEVLYPVV